MLFELKRTCLNNSQLNSTIKKQLTKLKFPPSVFSRRLTIYKGRVKVFLHCRLSMIMYRKEWCYSISIDILIILIFLFDKEKHFLFLNYNRSELVSTCSFCFQIPIVYFSDDICIYLPFCRCGKYLYVYFY